MDGSARGSSGLARIGGVLRIEEGSVMVIFFKAVGCINASMVEILAIKEAFKIYGASKWAGRFKLSKVMLVIPSNLFATLKGLHGECEGLFGELRSLREESKSGPFEKSQDLLMSLLITSLRGS
ncbi:Uncharacterized protein TCM_045274 [Theobroma cacao]|uniref:Uncharacterized protein n=1 Tax=Theobroma cacao TaxID=3641 RepID=A0A061FSK5_THECC|nr:Uncharacterized protein TCM_045274 [Theobroma cacao]